MEDLRLTPPIDEGSVVLSQHQEEGTIGHISPSFFSRAVREEPKKKQADLIENVVICHLSDKRNQGTKQIKSQPPFPAEGLSMSLRC